MKIATFIAAYLICGFLTGGYYFNHRCGESRICGMDSVMAGVFWPTYWGGRGSLWITA